MHQSLQKTVMFVSHDIDEAVKMGDRIAIFRPASWSNSTGRTRPRPSDQRLHRRVRRHDRTLKRCVSETCAMPSTPPQHRFVAAIRRDRALSSCGSTATSIRGDRRAAAADGQLGVGDLHGKPRYLRRIRPCACRDCGADDDLRTAVSHVHPRLTWVAASIGGDSSPVTVTQRGITHLLGETYRVTACGGRRDANEACAEAATIDLAADDRSCRLSSLWHSSSWCSGRPAWPETSSIIGTTSSF